MTYTLLERGLLVGMVVGMVPICAASAQPIQTRLPFLQNESAGYGAGEIAGGLGNERRSSPAIAIGIPTARGAEFGNLFGGVSYQRYLESNLSRRDDGAAVTGLGLGDARKTVGVEVRYAVYDLVDDPFSEGSLSLKAHRHVYRGLSIAAGIEDMVQYGGWDSRSAYVVASQTLRFRGEVVTGASATLGIGDGRFNTMKRLSNGTNGAGLFGGLSVQLANRMNVMATWYGQDLSLGLSAVVPGPIPITLTPAWVSVLGKHVLGDRLALSVGTSLRLP